jgi:hypothetical protein
MKRKIKITGKDFYKEVSIDRPQDGEVDVLYDNSDGWIGGLPFDAYEEFVVDTKKPISKDFGVGAEIQLEIDGFDHPVRLTSVEHKDGYDTLTLVPARK